MKEKEEKLEIFIPNGPRLGNKVIEAKHVAKAYGDKLLFDDLNFMLPPNGIVGVIGPNGAGKTTLFRLIMGLETVDKGEFEVGETVKVAYVDQQHKDIDPNKSVYQVISGGNDLIRMGGRDINARAYLSRFNFCRSRPGKTLWCAFGWRAESSASGYGTEGRRKRVCCSTSRPMISMSILCVHSKRVWKILQVVLLSFRMTVGSSIESVRIFLLSKAIRMCSTLKVLIRSTRRIN